jgi:hypothetical protein
MKRSKQHVTVVFTGLKKEDALINYLERFPVEGYDTDWYSPNKDTIVVTRLKSCE